MNFQPIWGVALRHLYLMRHDINLVLVSVYWPMFDVVVWSFIGAWIQQSMANYAPVALVVILLWQVTARAAMAITVSFVEELWSGNLINFFTSPLGVGQWILGAILFSLILILLIVACCVGLILLICPQLSLATLIYSLLLFSPPLFISGISLGFIGLQLMAIVGKRAQELSFVLIWSVVVFSGAYYPVNILPEWGKMISYCLPMSYILEGVRNYMMHGVNPVSYLIKGYILAMVYASVSIAVFVYSFNRSKIRGLARLSD